MGLLTKDVFLGRGGGVKKFEVCMGEEKTNEERRLRGREEGPLHTNVSRRLL
jgi:hypothetical protein